MAEIKESKKKYVVEKRHTLGHSVGAVIELTDSKAKSLIGKVRLQSDVMNESKAAESVGKLEADNAKLKSDLEKLKGEVKNLKAENTQLKKAK